jgi:hypothetical protein
VKDLVSSITDRVEDTTGHMEVEQGCEEGEEEDDPVCDECVDPHQKPSHPIDLSPADRASTKKYVESPPPRRGHRGLYKTLEGL